MGLSHSWVAVRTSDRTAVLTDLKVEIARELDGDDLPRFGVASLPGGWTLVVKDDFDWAFKVAQALSRHGATVACGEEEHVNVSDACAYDGGALVWRITHDASTDPRDIAVTGSPPAALSAIREELLAEQAASDGPGGEGDVDYIFDVPPRLAQAVVGFRLPEGADGFSDLRKIKGPGLFARLFGGRS